MIFLKINLHKDKILRLIGLASLKIHEKLSSTVARKDFFIFAYYSYKNFSSENKLLNLKILANINLNSKILNIFICYIF